LVFAFIFVFSYEAGSFAFVVAAGASIMNSVVERTFWMLLRMFDRMKWNGRCGRE
jgi:hypothetical protein